MVKKYAELHCNDVEAEIKNFAITNWEEQFRFTQAHVLKLTLLHLCE